MTTPVDSTEKKAELDKLFKREERRKHERKIKKDISDWEQFYQNVNGKKEQGVATIGDRLVKFMNEQLRKSLKKLTDTDAQRQASKTAVDEYLSAIQKNLRMRKTLEVMTEKIFDKNLELYINHEQMLDDEKLQRKALADAFAVRMDEMVKEINSIKEKRNTQMKLNSEVRDRIK